MRILAGYLVACAALLLYGVLGPERPFSAGAYAIPLASVAIVMIGFNYVRLRMLRSMIAKVREAVPAVPTGIVEAPSEQLAAMLADVRRLGFSIVGTTETTIDGNPPLLTWVLTGDPGTTWVEIGQAGKPMAIFQSVVEDRRFLETTTSGGETIDHPALYARSVPDDPAGAYAAHRARLTEWTARHGPARTVLTMDDYLAVEAIQRELNAGLRIATFIERVVRPGLRNWAIAAVAANATFFVLWGLDIARR